MREVCMPLRDLFPWEGGDVKATVRVRPIFAWYDLWIGLFVDRAKRRVYVFPLPCLGLVIEWARR